jgi:hypothetical protein
MTTDDDESESEDEEKYDHLCECVEDKPAMRSASTNKSSTRGAGEWQRDVRKGTRRGTTCLEYAFCLLFCSHQYCRLQG